MVDDIVMRCLSIGQLPAWIDGVSSFTFGEEMVILSNFVFLASNVTNLQFQVHHNMAITKSFLDGCPDPERLLKILGDVKVGESALLTIHHLIDMFFFEGSFD